VQTCRYDPVGGSALDDELLYITEALKFKAMFSE